ncbi:hypothetical protein ABTH46_20140, partial [Acinetobacter baumannii]
TLTKTLSSLPAGPIKWPETKIPPLATTERAVGLRMGPAGTPGMLAAAAAAAAVSGRQGTECVIDIQATPGYAVILGER